MADPLRVALVVPFYDPLAGDDPDRSLARHPTLPGIAAALAARGHDVAAFQLFPTAAAFDRDGARFTFVPSPAPIRTIARAVHRAIPRYAPPYYEPAVGVMRAVAAWRPDVLHVFGLTLDLNLMLAARLARSRRIPLVVHYHGGLPDADPVTRLIRRHNLARAARVLFTSRAQADPWIDAGFLSPDRVAEVMETSTPIRPIPRAVARAISGIGGDPACLMVGRLHPVKDPVTALAGFALVAEARPAARLAVYSLTDELGAVCEGLIAALPALDGRVEFRGRAPAEAMPAIYSSADILLQASRREWSGLAVMEAMACGVVPVVTDLPPLRRMTAGGTCGRLFAPGDAAGLARAVLTLDADALASMSQAARVHFDRALSFDALARDLQAVYRSVTAEAG